MISSANATASSHFTKEPSKVDFDSVLPTLKHANCHVLLILDCGLGGAVDNSRDTRRATGSRPIYVLAANEYSSTAGSMGSAMRKVLHAKKGTPEISLQTCKELINQRLKQSYASRMSKHKYHATIVRLYCEENEPRFMLPLNLPRTARKE